MKKRIVCAAVLLFMLGSFFCILLLMGGCGDHVVEKYKETPQVPGPSPTSTPTPTPGGGDKPSYTEMKALLDTYCKGCHTTAQFMQNESNLRSSQVKNYLWSRRMPPANAPTQLPDATRNEMLTFF